MHKLSENVSISHQTHRKYFVFQQKPLPTPEKPQRNDSKLEQTKSLYFPAVRQKSAGLQYRDVVQHCPQLPVLSSPNTKLLNQLQNDALEECKQLTNLNQKQQLNSSTRDTQRWVYQTSPHPVYDLHGKFVDTVAARSFALYQKRMAFKQLYDQIIPFLRKQQLTEKHNFIEVWSTHAMQTLPVPQIDQESSDNPKQSTLQNSESETELSDNEEQFQNVKIQPPNMVLDFIHKYENQLSANVLKQLQFVYNRAYSGQFIKFFTMCEFKYHPWSKFSQFEASENDYKIDQLDFYLQSQKIVHKFQQLIELSCTECSCQLEKDSQLELLSMFDQIELDIGVINEQGPKAKENETEKFSIEVDDAIAELQSQINQIELPSSFSKINLKTKAQLEQELNCVKEETMRQKLIEQEIELLKQRAQDKKENTAIDFSQFQNETNEVSSDYEELESQTEYNFVQLPNHNLDHMQQNKLLHELIGFEGIFQQLVKQATNRKELNILFDCIDQIRNRVVIQYMDTTELQQTRKNIVKQITEMVYRHIQLLVDVITIIRTNNNFSEQKISTLELIIADEELILQKLDRPLCYLFAVLESEFNRKIKSMIKNVLGVPYDKIAKHKKVQLNDQISQTSFVEHPDHVAFCKEHGRLFRKVTLARSQEEQESCLRQIAIIRFKYLEQVVLFMELQKKIMINKTENKYREEVNKVIDFLQMHFYEQFQKNLPYQNYWMDFEIKSYLDFVTFDKFDDENCIKLHSDFQSEAVKILNMVFQDQSIYRNPIISQIQFALDNESYFQLTLHEKITKAAQLIIIKCIQDFRSQMSLHIATAEIVVNSQYKAIQIFVEEVTYNFEFVNEKIEILKEKLQALCQKQIENGENAEYDATKKIVKQIEQLSKIMEIEMQWLEKTKNVQLHQVFKMLDEFLADRIERIENVKAIFIE
ncbi:Hypothetical_protein [Hexamita inflata]|uniref:Hypothetical_protein n=1 Tax=Hexamita inflata TaxID=28002 RepID=A0AA86UXB8_9EUKA|nr:Hypothetical protein HINF_LOCUS59369 [Hexamita inflata]